MKAKIAGRIAKYFATSLAIEKVVSAPRVMSSCLPTSTISMSFVGLESRSTMLPASRAAWVPVFIATPTSACARAGASLVPSPVIATSRPSACSLRMSSILRSGVASARKSSTPASAAILAAVSLLSPVTMTVRMPIARRRSKRVAMPSLTVSLRWMTPSTWVLRATASGVPPSRAMRSTAPSSSIGVVPPSEHTQASIASAAPLRSIVPFMSTPLMRVCAVKGTKRGEACPAATISCSRSPYCLASTTIERPSGVSSASEESCATSARSASETPGMGTNSEAWRLPSVIVPVLSSSRTSTSPDASTARPERASMLRRTRRSIPAIPIALSRAPIVVGMSATRRATRVVTEMSVLA